MRLSRRAMLAAPLPTLAQGFPARPITLVIPFTPGGIVDTLGRIMAERAQRGLGQPITIDNRPGAGSAVGNAHVTAARPDGYTMLAGGIGLAIIPHLQPGLEPRDPLTQLAPIAMHSSTPYILHVRRSIPARNLAEFITWARGRGSELNAATSGVGSGVHLTWELFRRRAALMEGEVVHFRGGIPAITEIVAGRADFTWGTALEAIQAMRANQTRPIAVTSEQRIAALPDLPTVAESGFPGFSVLSFAGWFAPAGTPAEPRLRIAEALQAGMRDPELHAQLADLGITPRFLPAEGLAQVLETELTRWGRLIREAGIRAEGL